MICDPVHIHVCMYMYVLTSIPTNTDLIHVSYVTASLLMALPYPEAATQAATQAARLLRPRLRLNHLFYAITNKFM